MGLQIAVPRIANKQLLEQVAHIWRLFLVAV